MLCPILIAALLRVSLSGSTGPSSPVFRACNLLSASMFYQYSVTFAGLLRNFMPLCAASS